MNAQTKINAMWNEAAAGYDDNPRHGTHHPLQEAAWKDALRRLLPPPPAAVLDVGTGTGMLALLLADLGYTVLGIDLASKMLRQARHKARTAGLAVRFERGDAMAPPGDPESFDAVVSRHVLWTLTGPLRALQSWLRLLRPGGCLVIIDGLWGANPQLGDIAPSLPLAGSVSLDHVSEMVERAGFVAVAVSDLAEVDRLERDLPGSHSAEPHYVITGSGRS